MKYAYCLLIFLAATTLAPAQSNDSISVGIDFDRSNCTVRAIVGIDTNSVAFQFGEVREVDRQILLRDRVLISQDTLFVGNLVVNLAELVPAQVTSTRNQWKVVLSKDESGARTRRGSLRNRFAAFAPVIVGASDFVRGDVLVVGDEAMIEGEVNGNVVALFGEVKLLSTAICQRDVVAIGGDIHKHRTARVHGAYQSSDSWRKAGARFGRRTRTNESSVRLGMSADYNRVDGLLLMPEIQFWSQEKFVPRFLFRYGYGFTSKRSQYQLGMEQKMFEVNQTRFGGSVYRLTKTEDNWICDSSENFVYTLLIREDFRDYYGGEGGNLYFEQNLGFCHTLRLDYSYEELEWMPAHPGLWSLFGGNKRFRENFSSVASPMRLASEGDYKRNEAVLQATYVFNNVEDERGELSRAGWVGAVRYQHASDQIGSDFAFDRYTVELRRYQPLTYMQNLNVRLVYGAANGRLPLHRLFYLGGIRTLRAYDIKQFYGSRMALANCEYVVDFTHSEIGLAVLFDIGKTGWDNDFLSEGEWRGDVGIGAHFGDWLRLELTRQINGFTNKLQISGLIGRSF